MAKLTKGYNLAKLEKVYFVRTKHSGEPVGKFKEFGDKDKAFKYAKRKIDKDFGVEVIRQHV
ncbi:hypothetical protein LCGC14_0363160 [marine sediment metagenome]|uniref:Uncharacterized protein n=1 Tax=marine sediment metagenome TaxID=412755 RepID=A0A0F9T7C8_9ZZZZ